MIPLWLPVLLPITMSAVGYLSPRRTFRTLQFVAQIAQVAVVTVLFMTVQRTGPRLVVLAGWPQGIGIALYMDRPAAILVGLTAWLYLVLLIFNTRKQFADRLFQFLFGTLQGVLVGIFLSGDIFNVYVLLEMSTLIVAVLIMYKRGKPAVYNGLVYLMVNLASMSFMLLGIGFIHRTVGTLDLLLMAQRATLLPSPRAFIVPYSLVVVAVGVKSALFLLFGWLPLAHGAPSAPSSVSALLSGLQVKTGVYLLIRINAVAQAAGLVVDPFFLVLGAVTAGTGAAAALAQEDIKRILAYSTISQVGLIVAGLSLGTVDAWWGSVYHIVNHAMFKALLFLTAGWVVHRYGTRTISGIRGLGRHMPVAAAAMAIAMLGIVGAPYVNGSVSKYLMQTGWREIGVEWVMYAANFATALVFAKVATIFLPAANAAASSRADSLRDNDATSREVASSSVAAFAVETRRPFMTAAVAVLGAAVVAGGVAAGPITTMLFGVELSIDGALGLQKIGTFLATTVTAVGVYGLVIRRLPIIDRIRSWRIAFPDMAAAMVIFFIAIGSYLYLAGSG